MVYYMPCSRHNRSTIAILNFDLPKIEKSGDNKSDLDLGKVATIEILNPHKSISISYTGGNPFLRSIDWPIRRPLGPKSAA